MEVGAAELSNYAVGLVGCAVACIGFGCNLVPLKFVETGDGKLKAFSKGMFMLLLLGM